MTDREKVIADIEEQMVWIRDNDFHKFPGWGHTVLAMKDALAILKEQEAVVRCIDCECHRHDDWCTELHRETKQNDYCSWGVKKDE